MELLYHVVKACGTFELYVWLNKCVLVHQIILLLKFVISRDREYVNPRRTVTPIQFGSTQSMIGIASYLGLELHYRIYIKYIKQFRNIA